MVKFKNGDGFIIIHKETKERWYIYEIEELNLGSIKTLVYAIRTMDREYNVYETYTKGKLEKLFDNIP
jgi:hypothetical protein